MVGGPNYRRPVLAGWVEGRGEQLIGATATGHGWQLVALEIMPDPVHMFVKAHRSDLPSRIANPFEGSTWSLRAEFACLRSCLSAGWSRPCFAPIGAVAAQTMPRYVGTRDEWLWRKEWAR
jgi:putative transposase